MIVDLAQNTVDGVANGSAYALLALGFSLIFGVVRRINLSYGAAVMLGLYAGAYLNVEWHAPWLVVTTAAILGSVLAGLYVYRLCFAPMPEDAAIASMVASFAIWMQLEELSTLLLPQHSYPFPPLAQGPALQFGALFLRIDHLVMLLVALAVMIALDRIVHATRFGLELRALAESPRAARFLGIRVERSLFLAFALASAVGGIAGWLIVSADQQVTAMFGMWATFKGLAAMMLGGLGSLPGALVGGLLLGVVEANVQWFFGPTLRDLAVYALLLGILILRPGGLFGGRIVRSDLGARRRL